ncbi:MAG: cytochrome P450 [Pirellulales bacterium]|nr:cytochrome P450 [Pirellulales bacterium]
MARFSTDAPAVMLSDSATPLPRTQGRLLDFPADPIGTMRQLHARHGRLAILEEAGQRIVFGFGAEFNQQILSDTQTFHSQFFAIRGPKHSAQRRLTAGLLSMNGEDHKRHRRIVHAPFQKKSVAGYRDSIAAIIQQQLAQWRPGQIRNIHADSVELLLRITSCMLFGFDQRDLAMNIGASTERWVNLNHANGLGSLLSSARDPDAYDALLAQAEELETLIRAMIDLRREQNDPQSHDVLNLLLHARDEAGQPLSEEELIGQAAVLFAAAHMTTANSLSWTLFLLAQHPRVAHDLFDELWGELRGEAPTLAQLERLPLLDRVIKESMRCLPASSYSQRISASPAQIGPLPIPRGTLLIFSQFLSHHLEDVFPQAYQFDPARWESINPSPYDYLPFATGPRMCIGATMATMTLKLAISLIWQRQRLTVIPGAVIDGQVISTMLGPSRGIPMLVAGPQTDFASHWVRGNIHELVRLEWPTQRENRPRRAA